MGAGFSGYCMLLHTAMSCCCPVPSNLAQWGNLRYAANVAFTMLLRAQTLPPGSRVRHLFAQRWQQPFFAGMGSCRCGHTSHEQPRASLFVLPAVCFHPQDRIALVKFARVQVDYCMGATGRSFIVGFGRNPPRRVRAVGAVAPAAQLLVLRGDWVNSALA